MALPCCSAYDLPTKLRSRPDLPPTRCGFGEIPFFLDTPAAAEPDAHEEERFLAELETDPRP